MIIIHHNVDFLPFTVAAGLRNLNDYNMPTAQHYIIRVAAGLRNLNDYNYSVADQFGYLVAAGLRNLNDYN